VIDPDTRRQVGIARIVAWQRQQAEDAGTEREKLAARTREAFVCINSASGAITRKAMSTEERGMFELTVLMATTDRARYEELRQFEDESAQTTRLDVLRSRAFHKAKAEREKHGWL
jgi:hypothetical protein